MITDSGERTKFESGAVRDIKTSNGRCDLLPMEIIGKVLTHIQTYYTGKKPETSYDSTIFTYFDQYQNTGNVQYLYEIISCFIMYALRCDPYEFMLELSLHFKEGAEKYGEYNWQKGIPTKSYIDSAVRHYLKFKAGWSDESHDRAFVWNLVCCIWTSVNKPEFSLYSHEETTEC